MVIIIVLVFRLLASQKEITDDGTKRYEPKPESDQTEKSNTTRKSLNRTFLPPPPSHLLEETIQ